jgi:hypothetical protein
MLEVDNLLGSRNAADPTSYTSRSRFVLAFVSFIFSALMYFLARGLWRVENWARIGLIAVLIFGLALNGGLLDPLSHLAANGQIFDVTNRSISLVILLYLFSSAVRTAFRTS